MKLLLLKLLLLLGIISPSQLNLGAPSQFITIATSTFQHTLANGTATTTFQSATSTMAGSFSVLGTTFLYGGLNASSTATTTMQNGIQLSTGCFRDVSGSCIVGGLTAAITTLNGLTGASQTFTTNNGLISISSSGTAHNFNGSTTPTFSGLTSTTTLNVSGLSTLGNATATQLTVTNSTYLATVGGAVSIGTTTPKSTVTLQLNGLSGGRPLLLLSPTASVSGLNGEIAVFRTPDVTTNVSMFDILANSGGNPAFRLVNHFEANGASGTIAIGFFDGTNYFDVFNVATATPGGYGIGIGTSTPGAVLGIQGNSVFSGNLNLANLTATGTLSVLGLSTLTGLISNASSTFSSNLLVSQALNASSTFQVGGLSTLAGFLSTASSTFISNTQLTGNVQSSSTLDFGGATIRQTLYPSFSYATTTSWTGTTTTIFLGDAAVKETWNFADCRTDAGTLNVQFTNAGSNLDIIKASSTLGRTTFTTSNIFNLEANRAMTIGTPATSPLQITCTISKTVNQ